MRLLWYFVLDVWINRTESEFEYIIFYGVVYESDIYVLEGDKCKTRNNGSKSMSMLMAGISHTVLIRNKIDLKSILWGRYSHFCHEENMAKQNKTLKNN